MNILASLLGTPKAEATGQQAQGTNSNAQAPTAPAPSQVASTVTEQPANSTTRHRPRQDERFLRCRVRRDRIS